jgi:hypothetical protein
MYSKDELELFLKNPQKYVDGEDLPAALPKKLTTYELKASFPTPIELRGYCPVSFKEGPPGYVLTH